MKRWISTEFTVGTFALLGLLVIIYMSLSVNDRGGVRGSINTYHSYFDSVTGLIQRVPVEVAGIPTGYVQSIRLSGDRAHVTVHVRADLKVFSNASLTVRDRGILGDRYVALNPGTSDKRLLKDGDEISQTFSYSDFERLTRSIGDVSSQIQELLSSNQPTGALGQIIVNLRDMSSTIKDMVGDNQGRIDYILQNMEAFTGDLSHITHENKDQIRTVLVALENVAVSLREAIGEGGSVRHATDSFGKTMASLQRITEKVERGEGTVGKLLNDETTVENLNQSLEGLNDTLGLFRKVQLGVRYRGEFLTSAMELQSLVSVSLAPAPDKFLLFEVVSAPQGETKVINTTVTSGGNVISATETIQSDDNILYTFLLGKRFWDMTLRFGLMRNEGGLGMDYHLWKDKFLVSFEAFDFSRVNNRVHLRAYGTLVLYNHLLLTGGVDDLATSVGGRNAFFGGGIQFTDQDLKALITSLPLGSL